MKPSARNTLKGKVVKVTEGAVDAEVTLGVAPGPERVAVTTLEAGRDAYAVIKASSVMVAVDD